MYGIHAIPIDHLGDKTTSVIGPVSSSHNRKPHTVCYHTHSQHQNQDQLTIETTLTDPIGGLYCDCPIHCTKLNNYLCTISKQV